MDLEEAIHTLLREQRLAMTDVPASLQGPLVELGIVPREGIYSLHSFELLNANRIKAGLSQSTRMWLKALEVVPAIGSTNTALLARARTSDIHGRVLSAEVQLAGRGRRGRVWVSPFAENIAVSMGVTVDTSPTRIGAISLVIGLAVARTIESLGIPGVQLKWPNDVLVAGRKVGGILIELIEAGQPAKLVIGIGVNVSSAPGVAITGDYRATCLNDHLENCSRNDVLAGLVEHVVVLTQEFEEQGFEPFIESWQARDSLSNQEVVLRGGIEEVTGASRGIDSDGAYLIQTSQGLHRAIGGDVSLRGLGS